MNTLDKIHIFAALLEKKQIERLQAQGLGCVPNVENCKTRVKVGQKYTKVDVGNSGRFMVENATGNIFGTKAYGVIHKGHFYGTVETTNEYNWGDYYPTKKLNPTLKQGDTNIPKLTFAPKTTTSAEAFLPIGCITNDGALVVKP